MRKKFNQILVVVVAMLILASCALFRPKCPIPNCKTRKYHQHALVFDMKALRKAARKRKINKIKKFFGIKEKPMDSTDVALLDSTIVEEEHEHDPEVEEEDGTMEEDPPLMDEIVEDEPKKETWKEKRARKKREKQEAKELEELEEGGDEDAFADEENFDDEGLDEPKKKKFKWPWQKSDEEKYLEEQEELETVDEDTELVEEEGVDEEDFAKEWRSRKWKFWGNQRPKVGQRWKAPKKK